MTTITDAEALALASSATREKPFVLTVSGNSMLPFLANGRDRVYICGETEHISPGTIVFYERAGGKAVLHRVTAVGKDGYVCMGDAQDAPERVTREQVRGTVFACERKGKLLTEKSPTWRVFADVWRQIPRMRRTLIDAASKRKRSRKE